MIHAKDAHILPATTFPPSRSCMGSGTLLIFAAPAPAPPDMYDRRVITVDCVPTLLDAHENFARGINAALLARLRVPVRLLLAE